MPKFLETKLRSQAKAEGKTGRAADRYVYGALNNMGAMRGSKETPKGKAMDAKHAAKLHPAMVARGTAIQAAHQHLAQTVKGFAKLPTRERFRMAHAHLAQHGY